MMSHDLLVQSAVRKKGLYILPQFLSNLTRPITHKVIFFVPVIATLPILGLKSIKLFLCVFISNFMVFMC